MKAFRRTASLLLALLLCFPMLATMLVSGLSTVDVSYYDGTYSTDWYYSNTSAKEFHLKSAADLAGYVYLVNTVLGRASFGSCTVKLDCNVVWNEGAASDWIDSAPKYSWTPISISENHYSSGGFDGQGHYISGLYQKDDGANHTGFIGVHGGSDWGVKNLAIVNSLFCKTSSGGSQNGNYGVGVFMSTPYNSFTFSNLYTDAIVMDSSDHAGGIVGNPRSNNAVCTLNNCVFAGAIISGGFEVGGMVGTNNTRKVRINNCLNLGSIYGKNAVGGMIGSTDSSEAVKQGGLSVEEQAICEGLQKEDGAISVCFLGQLRDHFKVNGRTSALSEGITVDWSGSSIEFNLNCSGDVKISAIGSYATALGSGNTNFTVYVDGVATKTVAVNNGYNKDILIASGLAAGEHHFRLSKWARAESAQVEFTKLSFQGELLARPADSEIFIEIVGDSISCGYGNNNGANDGNLSYGYIAADLLDADYSIFARSGLWLVNKGAAAIPDLYPYVSWYRDGGVPGGELYDFANARVPDVVVINLGTNDYNGKAGADAFAAAMKSFVAQIRQGYGNDVPIVWAYGMMNDGYKDTIVSVVEELGGAQSNNYALGFEQNNTGANSHPDTAHQQKNGEELADYIRELLK